MGIAAAQAMRQVSDGQRIGLGRVVARDHAKIIEHQEARSLRACRNHSRRHARSPREWLVPGPPDAELLPFVDGQDLRTVGHHEIEDARDRDFVAQV